MPTLCKFSTFLMSVSRFANLLLIFTSPTFSFQRTELFLVVCKFKLQRESTPYKVYHNLQQ